MSRNTYIIYCDSTSFSSILSSISPIISRIQVGIIDGVLFVELVPLRNFLVTQPQNILFRQINGIFILYAGQQMIFVFKRIGGPADAELFQLRYAADGSGAVAGGVQRGQQHSRQNRDDHY